MAKGGKVRVDPGELAALMGTGVPTPEQRAALDALARFEMLFKSGVPHETLPAPMLDVESTLARIAEGPQRQVLLGPGGIQTPAPRSTGLPVLPGLRGRRPTTARVPGAVTSVAPDPLMGALDVAARLKRERRSRRSLPVIQPEVGGVAEVAEDLESIAGLESGEPVRSKRKLGSEAYGRGARAKRKTEAGAKVKSHISDVKSTGLGRVGGLSGALGILGGVTAAPFILNELMDMYRKLTGTDLETRQFEAEQKNRKMDLLAGALAMREDADRDKRRSVENIGRQASQAIDREQLQKLAFAREGTDPSGGRNDEIKQRALMSLMQMDQITAGSGPQPNSGSPWIDDGFL